VLNGAEQLGIYVAQASQELEAARSRQQSAAGNPDLKLAGQSFSTDAELQNAQQRLDNAALALRNRWVILGTVVGGAMTIAISFAGILSWFDVSAGHFWDEFSAISLTITASALVVAGLVRLLGAAGVGLGALLLVIVGNPLSGIATSPRLLPAPWGEFGQWLPTGAGGTLLRTVAYFPGAPVWAPLLILLGWAVLGGLMVLLFDHSKTTAGHRHEAIPAP